MKHLLNTLFVTSEDIYLSLKGENVIANRKDEVVARYPLHNIQSIVSFSYSGASPALMGACAERDISIAFCTPRGKFLARTTGISNGNVVLRREQYRIADDPMKSCDIVKNMIFGKLHNSRWSLERTLRDHKLRVEEEELRSAIEIIKRQMPSVLQQESVDTIRGIEGVGASAYFSAFDQLILNDKDHFFYHGRNRRPPLDRVNALLSFSYSLLANDCASALESVGLDSYVGFMHRDRPGRRSLALDLMEELRPPLADRFVLTLINNRMISADDFIEGDHGAILLSDNGRKAFLQSWQKRKLESITHPFLKEKMTWGLVPYVQAMLLARFLRGDLDEYPPFLWK